MHSYENDQQKLNYLSDLFPRPKNTLVSFASLYINTFLATVVAICIQYMNKGRTRTKITGLFGNFSQMADIPPHPLFWETLIKKKIIVYFAF